MSRTVSVNPLLVLVSILVGASIGDWLGGTFGAFVAALISIPAAGAIQVVVREVWQETAPAVPDATGPPGPPSTTAPPTASSPTAQMVTPSATSADSAARGGEAGVGEG